MLLMVFEWLSSESNHIIFIIKLLPKEFEFKRLSFKFFSDFLWLYDNLSWYFCVFSLNLKLIRVCLLLAFSIDISLEANSSSRAL